AAVTWLAGITEQVSFADRAPAAAAVNIAFTHRGLARLGLEPGALEEFPEAFRLELEDTARRAHRLGDEGESAPVHWRWGKPENGVDALLLLYAADVEGVSRLRAEHEKRAVESGLKVVQALPAATFREPFKEPFGFADGISQPAILCLGDHDDSERPLAT